MIWLVGIVFAISAVLLAAMAVTGVRWRRKTPLGKHRFVWSPRSGLPVGEAWDLAAVIFSTAIGLAMFAAFGGAVLGVGVGLPLAAMSGIDRQTAVQITAAFGALGGVLVGVWMILRSDD